MAPTRVGGARTATSNAAARVHGVAEKATGKGAEQVIGNAAKATKAAKAKARAKAPVIPRDNDTTTQERRNTNHVAGNPRPASPPPESSRTAGPELIGNSDSPAPAPAQSLEEEISYLKARLHRRSGHKSSSGPFDRDTSSD